MAEAKFSRGDWRRDLLRATRVVTDGDKLVCECLPSRTVATVPGLAEALANARAIAALPRLVAACVAALSAYDAAHDGGGRGIWHGSDVDAMREAVALALGDS